MPNSRMMAAPEQYSYELPEELIAKEPANPRDSSRLFVYETRTDRISFAAFRDLPSFAPPKSLFVFNDTKVVPARLILTKPTGGKIEVFLLLNEWKKGDALIKGMTDRKAEVGWKLSFPNGAALEIVRQENQYFFFRPSVTDAKLWALIEKYGNTPIPKYIKGTPLLEAELRERYQSIFAAHPASVAAPTASLHFTPGVLERLRERGCGEARVTLHVGPGTFAPVTEENLKTRKLHVELANVEEGATSAIATAKRERRPVIPVGTTALRTLEAYAKAQAGAVRPGERAVDLFIYPPFDFQVADGLLTNFHLPKSSLMMLVDAFLRHKEAKRRVLDLYRIAIEERFRFYSFGDAMFII